MRYVYLDGGAMRAPADLHRQVRARFGVPPYYGETLDALYDVLTECTQPTCIIVLRAQAARRQLGRFGAGCARVLRDAARANRRLHVQLW